MMRGISICAGIGGGDLACEMTQGIEIVGQVEQDDFCREVLDYHWPGVPKIRTIQEFKGHEFGPVDICIAGIPCQPFSDAGQQRGSADERNLWPDMWRILSDQCDRGEPYKWFVLENVKGLMHTSKGEYFKEIIKDLGALGYRVGWCVYGACEVGAPHRRERVFVVAHYTGQRGRTRRTTPAHQPGQADIREDGTDRIVADTTSSGQETKRLRAAQETAFRCSTPVADTSTQGLPQRQRTTTTGPSQPTIVGPGEGCTKSEMGGGTSGLPDWLARYTHTHRWPSGPGQEQEEWEPPRVVTHRMPRRVAQIKALGNAIVPQQLYILLREIVRVEEEERA